jgi:LemA protein
MGLGFFIGSKMDASMVLWIVVAMVLFWVVGLYNRLMRIRARAMAALRSVEKHMRHCIKLAQLHVNGDDTEKDAALGHIPDGLRQEQAQLLVNLQLLDQALKDARGMPLARKSVARVGELFEVTQSLWLANCNGAAQHGKGAPPEAIRVQWDMAAGKAQTARAGLNTILFKYNEAIYQFPARLVVGVLGFRPAGPM